MNKIFVFSPDRRVFEDWLRINNFHPKDYQHITGPSSFRGMIVQGNEKVIIINHPAWDQHKLYELKYLARRGGFTVTEVTF